MRCFQPWKAWQPIEGGKISAYEVRNSREIELPCGQCIGCRLKRAESWAVRCVHESRMHHQNCFITLTYDDENLPQFGNLQYSDFQKFCKRLRKAKGAFRFFMCGEYGELEGRPHYHACVFGLHFEDRKLFKRSDSGSDVFVSEELSDLWPSGHASVGDLTFESAAYVARYVVKKVTGDLAEEHYTRMDEYGQIVHLTPEFTHGSNGGGRGLAKKGGLGKSFYEKYRSEILVRDACIIDGKKRAVPRYYDRLLDVLDGDRADSVEFDRYLRTLESKEVITERSLKDQEQVTIARLNFKKRNKL